ncbi:cytochrome P450 76T24-like [Andrographis paniculata]|uniref:cytochrome P450 76T24-like n=1 Tax=Andrographis paniculata TaxID=175694 RepID=UPI0021E85261|nr:cytochrome P450 76T24-like [Andrographis paniculata]
MDLIFTLLVILPLAAAGLWFRRALRRGPGLKLPPGPTPLPILGNILSLGRKPHQSLARLARVHGPIMLLKLGTRTAAVISSPEAARAVLQKQDLAFCNRSVPDTSRVLDHHRYSVVWLPVGDQWRMIRRICKDKMFSAQCLDAGRSLRMEKLKNLVGHVDECCASGRAVDVGKAAFTTSLNLMWTSLFSADAAELGSSSSSEFRDLVSAMMELGGKPNLSDYFPILRGFDPQGIFRSSEAYVAKCFALFDEIIDRRVKMKSGGDDRTVWNDMLETLLEFNREDPSRFTLHHVKNLLLNLFVAGSDTTSGTVEWAMAELIRNPDKLRKARHELRTVLSPDQLIQESDISQLPYLRSIVKETFRLHPTLPLLLPRKAMEDTELNGYIIPKNAQIMVNIWAIGRDTEVWQDADKFIPERFMEKDIDFRGQHFELTPFGGGRRICLGLPLAYRMVHIMLASFVKDYEWKLEEGTMKVDMEERFGLSLQKAISLTIVPNKLV